MTDARSADGYTGPRPSRARPWAPWVIVTSALASAANAVVCGLNLVERHYQQQRLTDNPPSASRIRHTLNAIHAVTSFELLVGAVFVVVGVVWSLRRRSKLRLKREGEAAVEPALRNVFPVVYWAFWIALVGSVLLTVSASSIFHTGMTVHGYVTYRTRLAESAAARSIMWACWIPLVVRSTKLQSQREASTIVHTTL